jgi:hypothetical protein
VSDYSHSYYDGVRVPVDAGEGIGAIVRDTQGLPTVVGGSWNFDGFRSATRADTEQRFNPTIWHNFGKTVLWDSTVSSFSSDLTPLTWDASDELDRDRWKNYSRCCPTTRFFQSYAK